MRGQRALVIFGLVLSEGAFGCSRASQAGAGLRQQVTYDETTGKLSRIASDLNRNGTPDTWTYMDGTRALRSEQDQDEDGQIDRWEYNRPDGSIVKVAVSQRKNGRPDTWTYPDAQGRPARIEYSDTGDEAKVNHREYYEAGRLVRVEEDTDGDGKIDKWESYDGPAIVSTEFDLDKDGRPDERLTFDRAGTMVSTETVPDGRGGYVRKVISGGVGRHEGP